MTMFMSLFAPLHSESWRKEENHLRGVLFENEIAKKYLLPTIMKAYGDVEKTGSDQ